MNIQDKKIRLFLINGGLIHMELTMTFGGGRVSTLQYSCLDNPMHRGACWAMVCRFAKS